MKVYYVIYMADSKVAEMLDAMRLLCNPQEKLRSHITLKGPYARKRAFKKPDKILGRSHISVHGVGCFFQTHQSTVFFDVHSSALHSLLDKPDFPKARPHLTIYDGDNRRLAEKIYNTFVGLDIAFQFEPSSLTSLLSTGEQGSFDIWSQVNCSNVESIIGIPFNRSRIISLTEDDRTLHIEKLVKYLFNEGLFLRGKSKLPSPDERVSIGNHSYTQPF